MSPARGGCAENIGGQEKEPAPRPVIYRRVALIDGTGPVEARNFDGRRARN